MKTPGAEAAAQVERTGSSIARAARARHCGGIRHGDGGRGSQRKDFSPDQDRVARRHHDFAREQNRRRVQRNGCMIEEPYRWVEAIANRREYIERQLAPGSPIAALGYREGILFVTLGQTRQKLFEIYDRIAMGAIGHPGDIERLRMAAIELASTEGFTRSAADVSLRRLAHYSLSPVMKSAFEQVYGAPYLARMIFAEVGARPEDDLFLRVEYDGEIVSNGATYARARQDFGVLSGTRQSVELMEAFLKSEHKTDASFETAVNSALDAWSVGHMLLQASETKELPARDAIAQHRQEQLAIAAIEAAVLERDGSAAIRYRSLPDKELRSIITQ